MYAVPGQAGRLFVVTGTQSRSSPSGSSRTTHYAGAALRQPGDRRMLVHMLTKVPHPVQGLAARLWAEAERLTGVELPGA